jgi:hypothetical protein
MGVLLMLLTIIGLFLAACSLILSWFLKQAWLAKFTLSATVVWIGFYFASLLTISLTSKEETLFLNETKPFCGFYLDCHLHAAVTNVQKTKNYKDRNANGEFYVVRVKISSDAKRAELNLWRPKFEVLDLANNRFEPIPELENPEIPLERKISAGGAFEKEIVFDLPINVQSPRLDISEEISVDKTIEALLIDDEDSILHKRALFKLEPQKRIVDLQ